MERRVVYGLHQRRSNSPSVDIDITAGAETRIGGA